MTWKKEEEEIILFKVLSILPKFEVQIVNFQWM